MTLSMLDFSANLGFLWKELPLADAIRTAADFGFDAVECHWPYDETAGDVLSVLAEKNISMLGINTKPGNIKAGEFGLAALPGKVEEAKKVIDEAVTYAREIRARNIHVMAGKTDDPAAGDTFVSNLEYACDSAAPNGIGILIEAINTIDVPGYFLNTTKQARGIVRDVGRDNIAIMFDCYHVAKMGGDIIGELDAAYEDIGHIQFASVPDRGPPDEGEVNYDDIFKHIMEIGFSHPLGAEYKPAGDTEQSLRWLSRVKSGKSLLP